MTAATPTIARDVVIFLPFGSRLLRGYQASDPLILSVEKRPASTAAPSMTTAANCDGMAIGIRALYQCPFMIREQQFRRAATEERSSGLLEPKFGTGCKIPGRLADHRDIEGALLSNREFVSQPLRPTVTANRSTP